MDLRSDDKISGPQKWLELNKLLNNLSRVESTLTKEICLLRFTCVGSFLSAITLLGTPAEMYVYGTQYAMLVLSFPLVMAAAAHMYMPVFYELNVTTSYEVSQKKNCIDCFVSLSFTFFLSCFQYLEWRFNKPVRLLGAFCFVLYMVRGRS